MYILCTFIAVGAYQSAAFVLLTELPLASFIMAVFVVYLILLFNK